MSDEFEHLNVEVSVNEEQKIYNNNLRKDCIAFSLSLKGNIGLTFLLLPSFFSHVGLINGCLILFVLALFLIMVSFIIKSFIEELKDPEKWSTLAALTANILYDKHSFFQKQYKNIYFAIALILCGAQLAVCISYGHLASSHIHHYLGNNYPALDNFIVITFFVLLFQFLLLTLLNNYELQSIMVQFSFIIMFASMIIMFLGIFKDFKISNDAKMFKFSKKFFFAITGFVFAFEGIGLLIPVLKTASTPTRGAQMFSLAISFSVVVYCFTGIVVYLRVGNSVDQIFPHSLSGKIVQVATELYILGVQMGFGLQYLVAHEMMNALIDLKKSNPEQEKETMHQYMTKMYFVFLVMFLIIIFIPHLDALISIFGALFGVFLSFTLPLFLVGVKIISEKYQQAIFIDGREAKMKDLIKMDPKFGGKLLALGSIIISSLIIIFLSLTESISKIRKSVV